MSPSEVDRTNNAIVAPSFSYAPGTVNPITERTYRRKFMSLDWRERGLWTISIFGQLRNPVIRRKQYRTSQKRRSSSTTDHTDDYTTWPQKMNQTVHQTNGWSKKWQPPQTRHDNSTQHRPIRNCDKPECQFSKARKMNILNLNKYFYTTSDHSKTTFDWRKKCISSAVFSELTTSNFGKHCKLTRKWQFKVFLPTSESSAPTLFSKKSHNINEISSKVTHRQRHLKNC